jgi:hypothetical protein
MNDDKLPIQKNVLLTILIINLCILIYAALSKIYQLEFSGFLNGTAYGLFIGLWFILLVDMIKHKIYNKTFWILSTFLMPYLSLIFYVLMRDKLVRLGQKIRFEVVTSINLQEGTAHT